jgi:hypothetical protein
MPAITIDPALAEQLDRQAKRHNTTLEDWTERILREAATRNEVADGWEARDARRIELIFRELDVGLSSKETTELERLPEAAAKMREPADRQRLEWLAEIESQAGRLAGIPND